MLRLRSALFAAALCAVAAQAAPLPNTVTLRNYFRSGNDSLVFHRSVLVRPYPAEDSAFVVLQQNGGIITVRWNGTAWRKTDSASVPVFCGSSGNDEQGLLGFAFHPDYVQNRKYYLYYEEGSGSCLGNTARYNMVVERTAGASGRPATSDAQRTILRLRDPYDNHNGGTIAFDKEGYLVVGIGDGGTTQGDPQNRAQNLDSLHGKFLRLDVNGDDYPNDTTRNYAIPPTNPFAVSGGRPEIWAYGARNPWKWSFHPLTGELWAGEVGQWTWEKITRVPKGANLGWRLREGPVCFNPATNCPSEGLLPPALSLRAADAGSITGGVFFIGDPSSAYHGAYIFGDFLRHKLFAARVQDTILVDSTGIGTLFRVVSFDRTHEGQILATSISVNQNNTANNTGRVFVLESPDMKLASGTTGLRGRHAGARLNLRVADVLENPGAYEFRGLDGRRMTLSGTGTYWVRPKGSTVGHQLMTLVR